MPRGTPSTRPASPTVVHARHRARANAAPTCRERGAPTQTRAASPCVLCRRLRSVANSRCFALPPVPPPLVRIAAPFARVFATFVSAHSPAVSSATPRDVSLAECLSRELPAGPERTPHSLRPLTDSLSEPRWVSADGRRSQKPTPHAATYRANLNRRFLRNVLSSRATRSASLLAILARRLARLEVGSRLFVNRDFWYLHVSRGTSARTCGSRNSNFSSIFRGSDKRNVVSLPRTQVHWQRAPITRCR